MLQPGERLHCSNTVPPRPPITVDLHGTGGKAGVRRGHGQSGQEQTFPNPRSPPPRTVSVHSQAEVSWCPYVGFTRSATHRLKPEAGERQQRHLHRVLQTLSFPGGCKQLITLAKVLLGAEASSCLLRKLALYGHEVPVIYKRARRHGRLGGSPPCPASVLSCTSPTPRFVAGIRDDVF